LSPPYNHFVHPSSTDQLNLLEFPGDRETGTAGKLLVIAREDKVLQGVGLHSRQKARCQ
jgi:hypothetical protein